MADKVQAVPVRRQDREHLLLAMEVGQRQLPVVGIGESMADALDGDLPRSSRREHVLAHEYVVEVAFIVLLQPAESLPRDLHPAGYGYQWDGSRIIGHYHAPMRICTTPRIRQKRSHRLVMSFIRASGRKEDSLTFLRLKGESIGVSVSWR